MSDIWMALLVVAGVTLTIFTQVKGLTLTWKRTVVLPAVVCVIGAVGLAGTAGVGAEDVLCMMVSALLAAAIGVGQGASMHLEARDATLWGQMPLRGVWLWVALFVSRVTMVAVAYAIGAKAAGSFDAIILTLGINRLAQAAVVAARGLKEGVSFAS
jgi:hypothetical protein